MKKILMALVMVTLFASAAYAECFICDNANSDKYSQKITYKIVRGVGNTLFGWTELIVRPSKEMEAGIPFSTAVTAGLADAVVRTGNGLLELVTFWNPGKTDISGIKDCPICIIENN